MALGLGLNQGAFVATRGQHQGKNHQSKQPFQTMDFHGSSINDLIGQNIGSGKNQARLVLKMGLFHVQDFQHVRILFGNFPITLETARLAAMPCLHVDPKHYRFDIGLELTQFGDVLGRFEVLDL